MCKYHSVSKRSQTPSSANPTPRATGSDAVSALLRINAASGCRNGKRAAATTDQKMRRTKLIASAICQSAHPATLRNIFRL